MFSKKASGPEMFSGLTGDESDALKDKLLSGMLSAGARAGYLKDGYDMAFEISDALGDVRNAPKNK